MAVHGKHMCIVQAAYFTFQKLICQFFNEDEVLTGICVIRTVPCHKKLFSWKVFPATAVLFHDSLLSWKSCQTFNKGAIVWNRSTAPGDVLCGLLTRGQKQMQTVLWASPICISKLQWLLRDLKDSYFQYKMSILGTFGGSCVDHAN